MLHNRGVSNDSANVPSECSKELYASVPASSKQVQPPTTLDTMIPFQSPLSPPPPEDNRPVSPFDPDLDCPICYRIFVDPMQLSCGHVFCEECINQALDMANTCPYCRQEPQVVSDEDGIKADEDEVDDLGHVHDGMMEGPNGGEDTGQSGEEERETGVEISSGENDDDNLADRERE